MAASAPSIRLYFDHDADARLALALRQRSFDAVTAFEAGLHEANDRTQLRYASQTERVLVTHNVKHFPSLHATWFFEQQHHRGIIILLGYQSIGVWLRRMEKLFSLFSPPELVDQLVYVNSEFD